MREVHELLFGDSQGAWACLEHLASRLPQMAAAADADVERPTSAAAGSAAPGVAVDTSLAAVLEAINTGQRRMVAHMNSNYKEVLPWFEHHGVIHTDPRVWSELQCSHQIRVVGSTLSCSSMHQLTSCRHNGHLPQVLRAMRGELGKEIKRLETTYAANDARVVHLVNASAGRMQARSRPRPRRCVSTAPEVVDLDRHAACPCQGASCR